MTVKVDSSFLRLFRQSRYAASTDEDLAPCQNRRELFTVAAVCFVAKHDEGFARRFLEQVAGVPPQHLTRDFLLVPQKAFCADLLVTDTTAGETYVVEFKVNAGLMQKQRSDTDAYYADGGYGAQITAQFPQTKV